MNDHKKNKIQQLIEQAQTLPYRQDDRLESFLFKLKETIQNIFGASSQYLTYLQKIRFKPASFFSSEMEYIKSWHNGQEETVNLLRDILNDPQLNQTNPAQSRLPSLFKKLSEPAKPAIPDPQKVEDIRQSLSNTIDSFKNTVLNSLHQPHFNDRFDAHPLKEEKGVDQKKQTRRVVVITGGQQRLNTLAYEFLKRVNVEVAALDQWPHTDQSIIELFKEDGRFDFALVVLSPDFYVYPKDQSPLAARLMVKPEIVFQLGFLVGKLGRNRVVALYEEMDDFKRPTNYFEILYIPVDDHEGKNYWQNELIKRLNMAEIGLKPQTTDDARDK